MWETFSKKINQNILFQVGQNVCLLKEDGAEEERTNGNREESAKVAEVCKLQITQCVIIKHINI